jgi:hypothetical protein
MARVRRKVQELAVAREHRNHKQGRTPGRRRHPTTPAALAIIQAAIPLGLKAVGDALQAEVRALAGAVSGRRRCRGDRAPGHASRDDIPRRPEGPGSWFRACEIEWRAMKWPLAIYPQFQTPRAHDVTPR